MLSELQTFAGESNATNRDTVLISYSRDASLINPFKPEYMVRPLAEEQVSALLKLANQTEILVTAVVPVERKEIQAWV